MARVKTDLSGLNVAEKIQRGYSIVDDMDGNVHFPSPTPTLDQIRKLIEELEEAHQDAQFGGRDRKSLVDLRESLMVNGLVGLGGYVQAASEGDAIKILSSGYELKNPPSASKPVAIPSVPIVKPGRLEGDILVSWTPVGGARSYIVRISHDSGETWEEAGHYTKSKVVLSGLLTRSRPWFKVAAFGALGQSNWSEVGMGSVG